MPKGRDPMTGDVPVVPMTSVLGEMNDPVCQHDPQDHLIDPPRGAAVFVRIVLSIDVVPAMNGVSRLRDTDSAPKRQIMIVPHHLEGLVKRPLPSHRLTI